MNNWALKLLCGVTVLLSTCFQAEAEETAGFRDLFNGKDLSGWVNVNTRIVAKRGRFRFAFKEVAGSRVHGLLEPSTRLRFSLGGCYNERPVRSASGIPDYS